MTPDEDPPADPVAGGLRGGRPLSRSFASLLERFLPTGLGAFIARRLVALVLLGFGVTLVTFVLTHLVPGDPAAAALGDQAYQDPEIVRAFRAHYELDRPLPVQYWVYLKRLVHGDLGQSLVTRDSVRTDLAHFAPATAELALAAIVFALVVGVTLGVIAAMHRNTRLDQGLRVLALAGVSTPVFWLSLVALYVGFVQLGISPGPGRLDPGLSPPPHHTGFYTVDALLSGEMNVFRSALSHLILPAIVLGSYQAAFLMRFTRASVLEVVHNDYVRAARAKGLPESVVVPRHILRGALGPIVTTLGLAFGSLLSGTVLVEKIFAWGGLGQYAYESATSLDLPAIMGVSLFVALVYITVNVVVDVLQAVVDPRIRLA